ncbi:MAG TPA: hypothetical protein VF511_07745, partial [Chthoniobacterales bacterium]
SLYYSTFAKDRFGTPHRAIGFAQNAVNQFPGLFTPAGSVTQRNLQIRPNHPHGANDRPPHDPDP